MKHWLLTLHKRVDVFIEIPAFTLVVVTGMLLMPQAPMGMVFVAKLVFALLAVAANVFCVQLVFKRHQLSAAGVLSWQHRTGQRHDAVVQGHRAWARKFVQGFVWRGQPQFCNDFEGDTCFGLEVSCPVRLRA